jgi:mycothiol synthase
MPANRLSCRAYTGPQDLEAMLRLIKQRPPEWVAEFPGIIDLQELLATPKIQANTRLWTDPDGALVCFAFLDGDQISASVTFELPPGWNNAAIASEVIAWAEASIRKASPARTGNFPLEASANSENIERIALLEGLGFEHQSGGIVHMERSLDNPIEEPQLPQGFLIRPIKGEAEAGAWVSLHRAALGTENMTLEYKLAMMRTQSYDPKLDLVAATVDGGLAAYCVCFFNPEENALTGRKVGHTDPIATHPDFRRKGLSKALMLTGLFLLRARGMDIAHLGTSCENIGMIRTAKSVGFCITQSVSCYTKPIDLGRSGNG